MGAISDERAHLIENYIDNAEKTLRNFSKASQVKDLLEYGKTYDYHLLVDKDLKEDNPDPKARELQEAAQKYTEEFGNDIDNLEGVWIGTWETLVLTHTNAPVVGMTTRKEEDKLKQLRDSMLNGDNGLYDAGIIISPATQKQIVSMYIAIYDDNRQPIGLVGLGIFTEGLVRSLDDIPIRGVENSFYSMVNVNNGQYIFNVNSEKVGQPVEMKELKDVIASLAGSSEEKTDTFEYENNGKTYVSIYSYIPKKGWLLMIDDYKSEVYSLTNTMIMYLGVFGVVVIGLIIVFNFISKRQEKINQKLVSTIAKNNLTKKSLNTAMFKDVLTNVNNRISFSMDAEKMSGSSHHYFMMFNICEFSDINIRFGNDSGDILLVRTVETLKEFFPENGIYRTGSDEFVVTLPAEGENTNSDTVIDKVNTALRQLIIPENVDRYGTIYPKYKIAVIKKSGLIDPSVISTLKEMTNKTGEAAYGMIDYRDMTI
jgi:GGDEF domain-containing protein